MDDDRIATLNRLTGRISKGIMTTAKHFVRGDKVAKEIAINTRELAKELIRPNAKILDGIAKIYESYALWTSVVVDEMENLRDLIPQVTEVVRNSRDENGRFTLEEVKKAFSEADFSGDFRPHLHVVQVEDALKEKILQAAKATEADADGADPDPVN